MHRTTPRYFIRIVYRMYVLHISKAEPNEKERAHVICRLAVKKEPSNMWNRYRPYRRGIRFFPHIIPIAFPLIFPLGIGLLFGLSRLLFGLLGILLLVALAIFIFRTITLGSPQAAWDAMWGTGKQWQQKFTSQSQQSPYYQPQAPYYQPPTQAGQEQPYQQYGQGYQHEQPLYHPQPQGQVNDNDQPQTQYPKQIPPMQQ
jgi:hypothetical protein